MIMGIGTDLVQIARLERSLLRFGHDFAERLLTVDEFGLFIAEKDPARYLASRFAAKEAAVKALGTGFRNGLWFNQIGVAKDSLGLPLLYFLDKAQDLYQSKKIIRAHLSITHEREYALAFVILEG